MIQLDDKNFEETISNNNLPVLVDFWSGYCMPCMMLGPILEELDKEFKEKCSFAKLNIDENSITAQKYRIQQIPTIVLFKSGKPHIGFIGLKPKELIKEWLEKNI